LLGQLDDNVFGKTSAEIYLKFNMQLSAKPDYNLEKNLNFDSLVLVLQYDTLGTYANNTSVQNIKIYPLVNTFSVNDTFYSDTNLDYINDPIASATVAIKPKDSVTVINHVTQKSVRQIPQLRIRMNDDFGLDLINNANAAQNDTAFAEFIKGVYIKSTSINNTPFIYGFNFTDATLTAQQPVNKLIMYYNVGSGDTILRKTYEYFINTTTINRFSHDRSGSLAQDLILNPALGDSLTLLQAMGGVKTVISFKDLDKIKNRLINKAELEITIADIGKQNEYYNYPVQLSASYKNGSGNLQLIPDITKLSGTSDLPVAFNGSVYFLTSDKKYTLNITNYIKQVINKTIPDSDLYIGIFTESETAARTAFYGAKHSKYPIRLKITYTKN
jgi:hypothetical protein